jgi:hypothetical protein
MFFFTSIVCGWTGDLTASCLVSTSSMALSSIGYFHTHSDWTVAMGGINEDAMRYFHFVLDSWTSLDPNSYFVGLFVCR